MKGMTCGAKLQRHQVGGALLGVCVAGARSGGVCWAALAHMGQGARSMARDELGKQRGAACWAWATRA